MQIKKIISTGLLLYCFIGLYAQVDAKATAVLDKTASIVLKGAWTYDFDLQTENLQSKKNSTTQGSFSIKKEKFKLVHSSFIIFYDGKTQWAYNPETEEVNISNPTPEELEEINPVSIFSNYKDNFKVKYNDEESFQNKTVTNIDLYPNDREKTFFRIHVKIDKSNNQPVCIESFGKDGTNISFLIKKISNTPIDDTEFMFDSKLYPGVEIIDLR